MFSVANLLRLKSSGEASREEAAERGIRDGMFRFRGAVAEE